MAFKKIIAIEKPLCLTVVFANPVKNFTVRNSSGKIFYLREFIEPTETASFNINRKGLYCVYSDSAVSGCKKAEIKKATLIPMPLKNWNYPGVVRWIKMKKNNSPASIIPSKGIGYINPIMDTFPLCVQDFIMAHELGHRFYASEAVCDLYAINYVLQRGGNLYPCLYTLKTVLKRTPLNVARIEDLIRNIMKSNYYGK